MILYNWRITFRSYLCSAVCTSGDRMYQNKIATTFTSWILRGNSYSFRPEVVGEPASSSSCSQNIARGRDLQTAEFSQHFFTTDFSGIFQIIFYLVHLGPDVSEDRGNNNKYSASNTKRNVYWDWINNTN
jgi:hypothetical protein